MFLLVTVAAFVELDSHEPPRSQVLPSLGSAGRKQLRQLDHASGRATLPLCHVRPLACYASLFWVEDSSRGFESLGLEILLGSGVWAPVAVVRAVAARAAHVGRA